MERQIDGVSLMSLRQRAGLTQAELASLLKVTDHTVRNWEKGRSIPEWTPSETLAVCKILGCSLEQLAEAFCQQIQQQETKSA